MSKASLNFEDEERMNTSKRFIRNFVATLTISSFALSIGNILAWTAPVGLIIKNSTRSPYDFEVSDEEFSYIASSMTFGN